MPKIYQKSYKILLIVLLGLLGICVWQSFFYIGGESSLEQYDPMILLMGVLVLIFGGIAVVRILRACTEKTLARISIFLLVFILIELIIFGFGLIYLPPYDLIHVHAEAVNMLETKKIVNIAYFAKYPNQQPVTILLYFIFSFAKLLGITNYNMVGIVFNILTIFLSAWFVYKICCFWSIRAGVIGLFLFAIDPMLFTWASHYYTDTICLPFMLGGVYLFLRAENSNLSKNKFLLYVVSAFIILLGGKIRVTSTFVLIAFSLYLLMKASLRVFLKKISAIIVGIICATILCNVLLSTYGVEDKRLEFPAIHWIKLGLNEAGNGAYTNEDGYTTMSEPTYEEKVEENVKTIKKRVKEMGVSGIEKLYLKKMTRTWSTAAYTEPLQKTVKEYNLLYKYTVGRSSIAFQYWMQIVRCGILILAFVGVIFEIRRKEVQNSWIFITLLGGIVFYIFWEAKPKYSLCFLPILYLMGTYSLTSIAEIKELIYIKFKRQESPDFYFDIEKKKRLIKGVSIFAFLCTVIIGILSYSKYITKQEVQKDLRVKQEVAYGKGEIKEIDAEKGITQSFISKGNFNTIDINFLNPNQISGQRYILKILDDKKNVVYSREFSSDDIKNKELHTFTLDEIKSNNDRFYLNISPCQMYQKNIGVNTAIYLEYAKYKEFPDYYPEGCLYVGEKKYRENDLAFVVSNKYKDSIFSSRIFFAILGIILMAEVLISAYFYRNAGSSEAIEE